MGISRPRLPAGNPVANALPRSCRPKKSPAGVMNCRSCRVRWSCGTPDQRCVDGARINQRKTAGLIVRRAARTAHRAPSLSWATSSTGLDLARELERCRP